MAGTRLDVRSSSGGFPPIPSNVRPAARLPAAVSLVAGRVGRARDRLPGCRGRDRVPDRRRARERGQLEDRRELWTIALAVLLVGLVRALFMVGRRLISGRQALGVEYDMRDAVYAKLLRLSFGFYDRHQTGQLMSRATVDLQSVRFFLGYGLIFFFQHVLTIVGVSRSCSSSSTGGSRSPRLPSRRCSSSSPTATPASRTRSCATCSRRWPTSRRSPRRTSSASTSSSPSRRSGTRPRSSPRGRRASSAARSTRTASGRSTCPFCRSCHCWRRRPFSCSAAAWSRTARSGSISSSRSTCSCSCSSCRCGCSACGSARRSAPPRRASGSSR